MNIKELKELLSKAKESATLYIALDDCGNYKKPLQEGGIDADGTGEKFTLYPSDQTIIRHKNTLGNITKETRKTIDAITSQMFSKQIRLETMHENGRISRQELSYYLEALNDTRRIIADITGLTKYL